MPVDETLRAVELIESGRYPFEKMQTNSFPLQLRKRIEAGTRKPALGPRGR